MLVLRLAQGLALGYTLVVLLAWLLQERLAFPAPRAPVPDPRRLGLPHGERIELALGDGERLAGGYLAAPSRSGETAGPRLLWVYRNGADNGATAPVLRA